MKHWDAYQRRRALVVALIVLVLAIAVLLGSCAPRLYPHARPQYPPKNYHHKPKFESTP